MEFFDHLSYLIQNNFWVRTVYVILCGAAIYGVAYWLDKRGQKNGLSDNESMMD
jgi:hypothetical protein